VDIITSAHFGHHPHFPTLRPDVTDRALTLASLCTPHKNLTTRFPSIYPLEYF
jgi:hypothetical protein